MKMTSYYVAGAESEEMQLDRDSILEPLKTMGFNVGDQSTDRDFDLKLIVLSGALKARETKMITPAQTCEILTLLLKGDILKAVYKLHTLITAFAMRSE